MSERRACRLLDMDRTSARYQSTRQGMDEPVQDRLRALARAHPRYGYRRCGVLLRREGCRINMKRVYRLYRAAGLAVRRVRRKRLSRGTPVTRAPLTHPNEVWAMDFVSDTLAHGQVIRALTLVDQYSRECLAIEVDTSLSAPRVTRVLDTLSDTRGLPERMIVDNGPEFTSRCVLAWCAAHGVELDYIQPGRPTQNAYIESFNGRFRDECLNVNWFINLYDARRKIAAWRIEYNQLRPHSSLAYRTPEEFRNRESPVMPGR
jgi:putative transposase